jgi:hypothetical protein
VFEKVMDIVIYQAAHGLLGFLLENVGGILKRYDKKPAYIERVIQRLQAEAPWFVVRVFLSNSSQHMVPQDRKRVLIVGYHRALAPEIPQRALPPPPLSSPSLFSFLEKDLPQTTEPEWTPKQWNVIMHKYVPALQETDFFSNPRHVGWCACFDAGRDPTKKFGSFLRTDDLMFTLTTGNRYLVVISGGEGFDLNASEMKPRVFRRLLRSERVRLQGLDAGVTGTMTDYQSLHASGNAYTASCVARHLLPIIAAMCRPAAVALYDKVAHQSSAAPCRPGGTLLDCWARQDKTAAMKDDPWRMTTPNLTIYIYIYMFHTIPLACLETDAAKTMSSFLKNCRKVTQI